MDAVLARKFAHVRRRLDQLGYPQPLGADSLPLVERLFADLVTTTDSLRSASVRARALSLSLSLSRPL
jgi:centrosomal protein CEP135